MGLGFFSWTKTVAAMVALTAILAVACGGSGDSDKTKSLVPGRFDADRRRRSRGRFGRLGLRVVVRSAPVG